MSIQGVLLANLSSSVTMGPKFPQDLFSNLDAGNKIMTLGSTIADDHRVHFRNSKGLGYDAGHYSSLTEKSAIIVLELAVTFNFLDRKMGFFGTSTPEKTEDLDDLYSPSSQGFEQSFGQQDGYEKMPDFMSSIALDAERLQPMSLQGLDFLQIEGEGTGVSSGIAPSRSWSDDLCYGTGTVYLAGLTLGGAYGMAEGLRKSSGAARVRLNTTLNTITRRGPGAGNAVGVLAMMYTSTNSLIDYTRGTHDIFNSLAAGGIAGAIFKSTAGSKAMGISAAICAGVAGAWNVFTSTLE
ncbi:Tim17/Tim22/Tim23/Pmp24 family-domain-containing protein [Sporodiniella umbellata]|nr:Tim17/Tim22/Tim23/Pmp24 family-domain-containing protein [Sporodiniella umbellata]